MRLWSCLVLEFMAAGVALAGAGASAFLAYHYVEARFASEAAAERARHAPLHAARGEDGTVGTAEQIGLFLGIDDDALLEPLKTGAISKVKYNRGGSSISLRIDFDNGARAAFKPVQVIAHTVPRYEVAAFRFNRLLGLTSVPPAIGRKLPARDLYDKLSPESRVFVPRMREEMTVHEGGLVPGELSFWIPVIEVARINGYPVDSVDGIVTWARYLTVGQPIAHSDLELARQISGLVAFDFVIDNVDRWSGGNVRMSADGRVLYFMDNTAAFGTGRPGIGRTRAYLERVQKFSRSFVSALESMTEERVRASLTPDGDAFAALLSDDEIGAVLARRDYVLEYIDNLISTHGREAVMVFP